MEEVKLTNEQIQEVVEALTCCSISGCENCPFARYGCTCQQDLKTAALQALFSQAATSAELERALGEFATEREIWLARNAMLEKENAELRTKIAPVKSSYTWDEEKATIEEVKEAEVRESESTFFDTGSCGHYDPITMGVLLKSANAGASTEGAPTGDFSFNPKNSKEGKEVK